MRSPASSPPPPPPPRLALLASPSLAAEAAPTASPDAQSPRKPRRPAPAVRFATFNVRTSRADIGTSRHWLQPALSVAQEIKSRNPGIVAIQELGPGRADGKRISVGTAAPPDREPGEGTRTASAPASTSWPGPRRTWRRGPPTARRAPGSSTTRSKYRLISKCLETTGKSNYNSSCSMDMPIMSGDAKSATGARRTPSSRIAAPARTSSSSRSTSTIGTAATSSKEKALDALRAAQTRAVYNKVNSLAGSKPILFGGDINSWQTKAGSHAPFNFLTARASGTPPRPRAGSTPSTRRSTTGRRPSRRTPRAARLLSTSSWRRAPRASTPTRT